MIYLKTRVMLCGPKTPDRLLGLCGYVVARLELGATVVYAVRLEGYGAMVRAEESSLLVLDPVPGEEWRIAGMYIDKEGEGQ